MAIARPLYTRAMDTPRINAAERLIVALDFPKVEQAREFVSQLEGTVSHFKVGYHLHFVSGYDDLVDWLISSGKLVMLDTKVMDITETVRAAVAGAVGRKAGFLTIHGNGEVSDHALAAAVEAKRIQRTKAPFDHRVNSLRRFRFKIDRVWRKVCP